MRNAMVNAFYHSPEWEKARAAYISKVGGLCENCLKKGMYVPGRVVHHIKPITPSNIKDRSITLSFANFRYVCQDCHAAEHHPNANRYYINEKGEILASPPEKSED